MTATDRLRPDDWRDPAPRILPWCVLAAQGHGPWFETRHSLCPGLACACGCHTPHSRNRSHCAHMETR